MKHTLRWFTLAIFAPAMLLAQTVKIVQTNADKSALLASKPSVNFGQHSPQALTITVDDGVQYQTMDGFGASFTDSSAWLVWNKLSAAQRQALMKELFTPSGINLSFLRQPMGASDLALSNYSYDDVTNGADPEMLHFSIDHDKAYILPVLREALALNPRLTVMALPWSAPGWMKVGGSLNGGSLNEENLPALGRYFEKFLEAYAENGVPVTRIAAQNEPLNNNNGYPTEFLSNAEEGQFIAHYLGPMVERYNREGNRPVEILGYEHNWNVQWYAEWLLRHPGTARYIAGTSFHCYGGDATTAYTTLRTYFPEKGLWFTECSGTVGSNFGGDLGWNGENLTIGSVRNGAKSVLLWNIALDQNNGPINGQGCHTCRGVVTIDTSTTPATITRNVEYYVLGQAAKFVVPGASRIDSNSFGNGSIEDVAFKNPDGTIVVLVYNSGSSVTPFSISWGDRNFSYTLPAGAVATFEWCSGRAGNGIGILPESRTVAQGGRASFAIEGNGRRDWDEERIKVSGMPPASEFEVRPDWATGNFKLMVLTSRSTPTGTYLLKVYHRDNPADASTVKLVVGTPNTAFPGPVPTVPGATIQAENWDAGSPGVAYFNPLLFSQPDASPYRPGEQVALEQTADEGGGYDVQSIGAGEWLEYTVNVATAGVYSVQSRLASRYGGTYYHVNVDGHDVTGNLYWPNTGWWQNWTTEGSPAFVLGAGTHVIRYEFDSNNGNGGMGNFNWFQVASAAVGTSHPFGGTNTAIPGVIQAENFDTGGKNVAYYNSSNNNASVYRTSDTVGLEVTSDEGGGYHVGNTNPGDWLNYTVDIAATRKYALHVRVASGVPGGTFHFAVDGRRVTRSISVPFTNGWGTFETLDVPEVELPAGVHVVQLVMDNPGVYSAIANFNWFSFE